MIFPQGDRRELFRRSAGQWIEKLAKDVEQRVSRERHQRPPGALPEVAFLAACTRCSACIDACPEAIIRKLPPSAGLAAGTPALDLAYRPCIACADMPCAAACPTAALTVPPDGWAGYRLAAIEFVPERCVTYRGDSCRVCAESCPVGEAALAIDELGHPVLKHEGCVGCGQCVRSCITSPSSFVLRPAEG